MGAAGFGGSFAPIVQYEKWEIHKVFPHFPYFRLDQNLAPNLLAPLCGIALKRIPPVFSGGTFCFRGFFTAKKADHDQDLKVWIMDKL